MENYWVNVTDLQVTIHKGHHYKAMNRHGPFASTREAVTMAHTLAAKEVVNCSQCNGAGAAIKGPDHCHCRRCLGE